MLPTTDAVRVVTGAADAVDAGELTAYEIPLTDDGEPVTAPMVLSWVRTLATGGPVAPSAFVMGMALVRVDPAAVAIADPPAGDRRCGCCGPWPGRPSKALPDRPCAASCSPDETGCGCMSRSTRQVAWSRPTCGCRAP